MVGDSHPKSAGRTCGNDQPVSTSRASALFVPNRHRICLSTAAETIPFCGAVAVCSRCHGPQERLWEAPRERFLAERSPRIIAPQCHGLTMKARGAARGAASSQHESQLSSSSAPAPAPAAPAAPCQLPRSLQVVQNLLVAKAPTWHRRQVQVAAQPVAKQRLRSEDELGLSYRQVQLPCCESWTFIILFSCTFFIFCLVCFSYFFHVLVPCFARLVQYCPMHI